MRKPVEVTIPHRHTKAEAVSRIRDGLTKIRPQIAGYVSTIEDDWTADDHMEFRLGALGQSVTGRIDVRDQAVRVEVDLPWVFAALAQKIRGRIEQHGTKMLEGPKKS